MSDVSSGSVSGETCVFLLDTVYLTTEYKLRIRKNKEERRLLGLNETQIFLRLN
jgi:hypothetical protein